MPNQSPPIRLFKYVRPDICVRILQERRILFSPPSAFNDPFECLPSASLVDDPAWQERLLERFVSDQMAEEHLAAAKEKRSVKINESTIRRKWPAFYAKLLPGIKSTALQTMDSHRQQYRICCLSAVGPDQEGSLLLWGHYAQDHRGAVIEFDPQHAWFKNFPRDASGFVDYNKERCRWILDTDNPYGYVPGNQLLYRKSPHWGYEKEYRLVLHKSSPLLDSSTCDSLGEVPATAILSITIGIHANAKTMKEIGDACLTPELRHVRTELARLHPDEFKVVTG